MNIPSISVQCLNIVLNEKKSLLQIYQFIYKFALRPIQWVKEATAIRLFSSRLNYFGGKERKSVLWRRQIDNKGRTVWTLNFPDNFKFQYYDMSPKRFLNLEPGYWLSNLIVFKIKLWAVYIRFYSSFDGSHSCLEYVKYSGIFLEKYSFYNNNMRNLSEMLADI